MSRLAADSPASVVSIRGLDGRPEQALQLAAQAAGQSELRRSRHRPGSAGGGNGGDRRSAGRWDAYRRDRSDRSPSRPGCGAASARRSRRTGSAVPRLPPGPRDRSRDGRPCSAPGSMIATCSGLTSPARSAAAKWARAGDNGCPSMLVRSPTAAAARTRREASPGDKRSVLIKVRTIVPCVNACGRLRRSASAMIRWSARGIRFRTRSSACMKLTNARSSRLSSPPSSTIFARWSTPTASWSSASSMTAVPSSSMIQAYSNICSISCETASQHRFTDGPWCKHCSPPRVRRAELADTPEAVTLVLQPDRQTVPRGQADGVRAAGDRGTGRPVRPACGSPTSSAS